MKYCYYSKILSILEHNVEQKLISQYVNPYFTLMYINL